MSIPGVGPSIAGQVAQEATVSLCGRFVNLFQNRLVAGAVLTVASAVGIVGGFICGLMVMEVSESLVIKISTKIRQWREKSGDVKNSFEYNICQAAIASTTCAAVFISLNVIVSKCLKLPFSRLALVVISIGGGALGLAHLTMESEITVHLLNR